MCREDTQRSSPPILLLVIPAECVGRRRRRRRRRGEGEGRDLFCRGHGRMSDWRGGGEEEKQKEEREKEEKNQACN